MRHATLLFIFTALLLLGGCARHITETNDNKAVHTASDSVRIVEKLVSVPYQVPGDTTRVFIPVDCDSLGRVRAAGLSSTGERASVHVVYVAPDAATHTAGGLEIEADCNAYIDSLRVSQKSVSEIRSRYDSLASFKSQTIQVKYIPAVYKWALGLWIVLLVAVLVWAGVKLYLKFKP